MKLQLLDTVKCMEATALSGKRLKEDTDSLMLARFSRMLECLEPFDITGGEVV